MASSFVDDTLLSQAATQSPPGHWQASLPFELLLQIFAYVSGNDIINFLSTCRTYHNLVPDESIWRELCSRYGVSDLSCFQHDPHRTFFTVYTELLHAYGPLIGLWASDTPFKGNILEFRILSAQESEAFGWEGIVGEVWQFWKATFDDGAFDEDMLAKPRTPDFWEVMRIELLPTKSTIVPTQELKPVILDTSPPQPRLTGFSWIVHSFSGHPSVDQVRSLDVPMRRVGPLTQCLSLFEGTPGPDSSVQRYSSLHPHFPTPNQQGFCHNEQGRLPNIREHDEPDSDHRPLIAALRDTIPSRFLYLAPSDVLRPRSIQFISPPAPHDRWWHILVSLRHTSFHRRIIDMRGAVQTPTRVLTADQRGLDALNSHYFPVRFPTVRAEIDVGPTEDHWTPQSLEGFWLGAYSSHGTELLFVKWEGELGEVQAWKLTGDGNVPRGAMSWRFNTQGPTEEPPEDILLQMELGNTPRSQFRFYNGVGTIAEEGYAEDGQGTATLFMAITERDEIRACWEFDLGGANEFDGVSDVSWYVRYRGRDIASEKVLRPGVRVHA